MTGPDQAENAAQRLPCDGRCGLIGVLYPIRHAHPAGHPAVAHLTPQQTPEVPAEQRARSVVPARVDRREEVLEQIALALAARRGSQVAWDQDLSAARDLLPLIARFECEAAAKALNDAADAIDQDASAASIMTYDELAAGQYRAANLVRDRAAALTDVDGVQS